MAHKIIGIRTIIDRKKIRLIVLIDLENLSHEVRLTPKQIMQNTKIDVNELELLIGSYLRVDFYSVGEKMYSRNICNKPNSYVKEYYFTLKDSLENLRKINQRYLKKYKEINEIEEFQKYGKNQVRIELSDFGPIYLTTNRLKALTGLLANQYYSLIGSWMSPTFYKNGEKIWKDYYCKKDNTIVKEPNLRLKNNFQITEKVVEKQPRSRNTYWDMQNEPYYEEENDYDNLGDDGDRFSDPSIYPGMV